MYTDVNSDVCKCRCRMSTGFPANVDGNTQYAKMTPGNCTHRIKRCIEQYYPSAPTCTTYKPDHIRLKPPTHQRALHCEHTLIFFFCLFRLRLATNRHFQNDHKWSRFNGNYQNTRTSIFWLNGSFNQNRHSLHSNFWVSFGHKCGYWWHDGDAAVSNTK